MSGPPPAPPRPWLAVRTLGFVVAVIDRVFEPVNSTRVYGSVEGWGRWLFGYPLLFGQILLYLGMAWGIVGGELGVSDLFWHERWMSQFWVGASACMLFGVVTFVNTLLQVPTRLPGLPADGRLTLRSCWTLFPSRNPGVRAVGRRLFGWLVFLLAVVYVGKRTALGVAGEEAGVPHGGVPFVLGYLAGLLFAFAFSLADALLGFRDVVADQPWLRRPFDEQDVSIPAAASAGPPGPTARAVPMLGAKAVLRGADDSPGREATHNLRTITILHGMAAAVGLVALAALFAILFSAALGARFSPAVVCSLMLIAADVTAGFLAFRVRSHRTLGLLAVAYLLLANSQWVADRLGRHGAGMTFPDIALPAGPPDGPDLGGENAYRNGPAKVAPDGGLIDGGEWLKAFHDRWVRTHPGAGKPRLVLFAVSGGGIRAAVWTGIVLEGLEADAGLAKAGFRDHVRLFAGASGGMVGAAAYASDYPSGPLPQAGRDPVTGLRPFARKLAMDSLSPVVQTMLVRDFTLSAALPFRLDDVDRGRTLERAWDDNFAADGDGGPMWRNGSPFAAAVRGSLADEKAAARPSLVFSPMMVEDGKRLFISNHDLRGLTEPAAYRLDAPPASPNGPDTRGPAPLSLPGVEFFRLYPGAKDFRVGTAARMSASFPVVSPAVGLPLTGAARRVVDAGYFDNYGLDVLANWLLQHRAAVAEHTSGVLVVQVRAYPLEREGHDFKAAAPTPMESLVGAVSAPLQAILTARGASAYHRNNELLGVLDRAFNEADGRPDDFFATVAFELQSPAALSWYLTTAQKRQVAAGFYADNGLGPVNDKVRAKLDAIGAWFGPAGGR